MKLVASSAFAWTSRSSGTITGIRLVKPPNESGQVDPARSATSGSVQSGACPASATIPITLVAASTWSSIITGRRRPVRSSQAPRIGPETTLGSVTAATVAPARAALPVRSKTSRTTPTENMSSARRVIVMDSAVELVPLNPWGSVVTDPRLVSGSIPITFTAEG